MPAVGARAGAGEAGRAARARAVAARPSASRRGGSPTGSSIEKVDPGALAVAAPEGVELHVNLTAAQQPGRGRRARPPDVLRFAARRGLAVKVLE